MHGNQNYMINIESCDLIILPQYPLYTFRFQKWLLFIVLIYIIKADR